ncbi:MAG TPA: hypothetical protein PK916_09125 [Bacteroidota bacterium]|nr:hypothetical protein [Bacteroidota bacterium]
MNGTAQGGHYKKYQVYFFLYLAVICELLIIIVERDDAEASLLQQQRLLEVKNRKIILELLKNMPAVAAAGDNQLKVGEARDFTISVKGLGDNDDVTTPPVVKVYKDGTEIETLTYPEAISDSILHGSSGERLYRFNWKADKGPGIFELWVQAGTNRVSLQPDIEEGTARVKVGSLEFTRAEIRSALDTDPITTGVPIEEFVRQSETLNPDKFIVEVVAEEYDQLQIQADGLVTAVGYPAFNEIKVRGTTVDKIGGMNALGGGTVLSPTSSGNPYHTTDPERGRWVWSGNFDKPGTYTVTVDARDRRNAGPRSVARPVAFDVTVKRPALARVRPSGAFTGETFEMAVNVAGLENVGDYRWTVKLDGAEVAEGRGAIVRYLVPENAASKSMSIHAEYRGRAYLVLPDSAATEMAASEWMYPVLNPRDRIYNASFSKNGEYPINNVFSFVAARCGRCVNANIRNVDAGAIRVEATSDDGRDLLDDVLLTPIKDANGRDAGVNVKFFLKTKGKISRDGMDAVIRVRVGSTVDDYPVRLFAE